MTAAYKIITYCDKLLADKSVRRSYSDGRYEWRRRLPDGRVEWQDSTGHAGIDELLGEGVLKRSFTSGQIVYAREQGYGYTLWGGDEPLLTVNQSAFVGRVAQLLAEVQEQGGLATFVLPPERLNPAEEQQLRQRGVSPGAGNGGDTGAHAASNIHSDAGDAWGDSL